MEVSVEVAQVIKKTGRKMPTSSLLNPKPSSVSFCRILNCVGTMMPKRIQSPLFMVCDKKYKPCLWPDGVIAIYVEDPEWVFFKYHNWVIGEEQEAVVTKGPGTNIHPTASMGEKGLKVVEDALGNRLIVLHKGHVSVGDGCYIGPNSVIHRGLIDDTVIGSRVLIGALNNIGHNAEIGDDTIITVGTTIGGAKIGAGCWVGMGATILNGVSICDGVLIGSGAVVAGDITIPGKYVGVPARRIGDWDGRIV